MKKNLLLALFAAMATTFNTSAQTVNVPFSTSAAGKSLPIEWGMDTAWDDLYNVNWGIAHYGAQFTTGRISFQPYELVDATKINDASANFGLPLKMARKLQQRIDHIKLTGTTKVAINCDHEVLTRQLDQNGNYGATEDNVGKGNYVPTSSTINNTMITYWKDLIKASVKYAQAQGLEVVSVAPFNEPDYGWNQYYCDRNGYNETNQKNNGMRDFLAIAKAIKADDFFKTGAGKNVRVCGPNTLNCDRALPWYNYTGMSDIIDEGNTHQLAGSFDNYADFFRTISDAGKVATADELHNVGEAMVGAEYGMTNGIWWAFDAKARGQFMHDSNEGVRLGYAEDRSHWTSAAVYRNDKDGEIHGFIGSSERQANVSIYNFQCQDREVYFNGYGPQKEWSVTTVGGTGYQAGQINYEYLFDITYGEDVQSAPVDGNYQIMSAADMKLLTFTNGADVTASTQANNTTQRWHIYPDNEKKAGDCSYWFIDLQSDANAHLNLRDSGGLTTLQNGTKVLTYNANHDPLEQWYFRYAKDGYFYIITRRSNRYLYNNNGSISVQEGPTSKTSDNEQKKYLWRLMPTDATAEQTAPTTPEGLTEGTVNATSASISWTAVTGESKAVTYNVLRQDANGWNTIVRCQAETTFTDSKVEAGKMYRYKVQAVDYSGNRSEASEAITIILPEEESGETPTFTEGQWEWVGEELASKDFYLLNRQNKVFLGKNVSTNPSVLWTATYNTTVNFKNGSDNIWIQVNNNNGNISSVSVNTTGTAGTNASSDLSVKGDKNGYQFYYTRSWNYTQVFWQATAYGTGFISSDGNTISSVNVSGNNPTTTNNNTYWLLVSENQMDKYSMISDYTTAFNTAKDCLTTDLSSSLKKELIETLDACDGTINYNNIEGYISSLQAITEKCRNYTPGGEGGEEDFTGLIINPTIIQNGTTNDLPTGWNAPVHDTANDHYTQGTGNTRLEGWTNNTPLNVNYSQTVVVPNGLYTLTAVTHQDGDGNGALYGETYKSFEQKMPVGNGIENEAETKVLEILVTDGTLTIGIKHSGTNNWITADNFTLTRVSTPEKTALSHYTDAIDYLDKLADEEFLRNVDHEELAAARTAAHNCEENASAYETAIINYVAALKRAQAMVEQDMPIDENLKDKLTETWIGQTGGYQAGSERYNGDTPYSTGKILYQEITGLTPGATYKIDFFAVANLARNLDTNLYSGDGIAYLFANDVQEDISVINQDACVLGNYPRTLTCKADENGKIAYGIANRKAGGQWYVAKAYSIELIEDVHNATLSCNVGKYGTFVAPYDVTLPEGITAYRVGSVNGSTVILAFAANGGETLSANTPVIIKNTTDDDITKEYTGTVSSLKDVEAGALTGFLESGRIIPYNAYVLQTQNGHQAFYKVGTTFHGVANRCYLNKEVAQSSDAKAIYINFEDDETGITLPGVQPNVSTSQQIYDLSGRRVNETNKPGLYIKNGKKFVVK